mgnify:CR=1 FL=1|tara:strand:+ start:1012 stop:1746 length:735 start_codon:yes stop_codon:yes gene_type:complete
MDNKLNNNVVKKKISQGFTYFDILLFNCYNKENSTINIDKLNLALDDIADVYDKLFNFGLTLSGYQFIGLTLERNLQDTESMDVRIAYFILSIGFLFSLFGSLLSFIVIEYIRGIRDETPDFIVAGIKQYKKIFKLTDIILYGNSILFVVPLNILIYHVLDTFFGIIFNVSSVVLFFFGIYFHYKIIISRQIYNPIYSEDNFFTDFVDRIINYLNINIGSRVKNNNLINRRINNNHEVLNQLDS